MTSTTNKPLAVVTGASSGIGLELAKQFAENGYDLVIVAEDNELDAAASSLRDLGAQVDSVHTDLARAGGVEELVERVAEAARPVAAAALNAGVGVNGAFVGETKLEDHLREVDLNVRSTVHLAYLLLPWMVQAGEGRMLFTSSIAATTPGPFMAVYNASKAFVKSFAEAVREELRDTGVTVTTLMPGPTETEFFDRARMRDTKLGQSEKDSAADVAKQGYDALMAGKDHVVAGSAKNKAQAVAGNVLPDTALAAQHRKMSEPGTADSANE
jgi:short-subunit dehydrogenase